MNISLGLIVNQRSCIMELFNVLQVFLLVEIVICASLGSNPLPSYDDLLQQIRELASENEKLHKSVAELKAENAGLMSALHNCIAKEKQLSEETELAFWNCSGLATDIGYIRNSLITLANDIQSFEPLIQERVTAFGKKLGFIKNQPVEKTTRHDYIPQSTDDELFQVACSAKKSNGRWTVIQRRMDGKVNFYRSWAEYKVGFGNRTGEFFIGLDNLHWLTLCATQELRVDLMDGDNVKRYAEYDLFEIGDENESYVLKELGKYSGDAGDSLRIHKTEKFTTFDRDNDKAQWTNCAKKFRGAWWYTNCHDSNLNGEYGNNNIGEGINWYSFGGLDHSLKFVEIKVRPKSN